MEVSKSGSLAVRYRPRRFADVVGQAHVRVPLQRAVATDRLPAQLLFSGGSGLGKTTLARVTAAALLCETSLSDRSNGDACGYCESCEMIASGMHPDVVELDAASHGRVDEIRELASRAALVPLRGTHRIYIVDEAHGLSTSGGQAFLKLLEEPPAHVIFMLATTDPDKMLRTARGRCTEFELVAPSVAELADNLVRIATAERWLITDSAATEIVAAADADLGVRGTIMLLEKLAGVLASGEELTAEQVASLLGRPSSHAITAIADAIDAGDTETALDRFETLTGRYPVNVIVGLLAETSVTRLVGYVAADDRAHIGPALLRADAWRAAAEDSSHAAAVITIVKLARPDADPDANLTILIERAEALTANLRSQDSRSSAQPSSPSTPEPDIPTTEPVSAPEDVDEFLSRLAKISKTARAVVRGAIVGPVPGGFRIEVPNEATRQVLEKHSATLTAAAAGQVVTVDVSKD